VDSKDFLLGANQVQACFLERLVLSDAAWERMAPLIIGRPDQKAPTGRDKKLKQFRRVATRFEKTRPKLLCCHHARSHHLMDAISVHTT
jgi:hypothetical protein